MSNLLSKASILLTPTSFESSKLMCVKPNTSVGDFTFTRATTAFTRVNSSGLIESVGANVPRIDFLGGTGHVLLEPQSTNTATYSNDFTQGDIFNGSGNPSLTGSVLSSNQGIAPDGTNTAQKLIDNNDGSSGSVAINFFSTNLTSDQSSTISIFAKKDGAKVLRINMTGFDSGNQAFFDLENGTKSGTLFSTIEDYGNGWFRCSVSITTTTDTQGAILFNVCSDSNQTSITRDGTKSLLLWGMQSEESSFPTSYIPTSGTTVTRNKDEANGSGDTSLINSTEGVLYAEIAALENSGNKRFITLSDGSGQNIVTIGYIPTVDRIRVFIKSGNTTQVNDVSTEATVTNFNKIAVKYKENDFSLYVNGTETVSDTSGSTPIGLNELEFEQASGNLFEGKVKCIAVFKEALTDAQLISLTS